ncbi:MAG: glycerophosphodiester phosphodiesterase family protein [Burkholderiaceae bacterium]|nr:PEP-CTERM sorting domain-containing protein [Rhodoferax sp.]
MTSSISRRLSRVALAATMTLSATWALSEPLATLYGQTPIVIAHRGASGYLAEHTLGGYELAVKMGVDYIEPDLQLTKDGHLVAMHDTTLTRTTNVRSLFAPRNGSYRVSDFTLAEVKTLTVVPVGTAATTYPGFTPGSADPFRIPTFDEVIDLAQQLSASTGREIGIYPEAKQADPAMEDKILATLIARGYTSSSKVFIQSFSVATIKSLHDKQTALGLDFQLVVLGSTTAILNTGLDAIHAFADGVGVSIRGSNMEAFIGNAHAAGLLVHGYTFAEDEPVAALAQYDQFFRWGMDGVFSNYPDLAVQARDELVAAQVPEPASAWLVLLGLGGVAALGGRRRSAPAARQDGSLLAA